MNSNQVSSPSTRKNRIEIVPTIDSMISALRYLFEGVTRTQIRIESLSCHLLENPTYQGELDEEHKKMLDFLTQIKENLQIFISFPPFHMRHMNQLEAFHRGSNFEESIFIMTKYPEGESEIDTALKRVINMVSQTISDCGYYPRLASDYDYHPLLWDNIELYLLGCCRAVAIVEDRYKPELNPNVAMEWGWMRGMGRDVLFLVEKDFKHFRADWTGLTKYTFSWDNPDIDIKPAIEKWLQLKNSTS